MPIHSKTSSKTERESIDDNHIGKDFKTYIENRIQLTMISLTEQVSYLFADSLQKIIGIVAMAMGFLFAWFALAYYLSGLLESFALGFLVAALPLLLFGYIFSKVGYKPLVKKFQHGLLKKMSENFEILPENPKKTGISKKNEEIL
ncbi:MAG: hypothetical protein WD381_08275 [Balneolaceae bacterium]